MKRSLGGSVERPWVIWTMGSQDPIAYLQSQNLHLFSFNMSLAFYFFKFIYFLIGLISGYPTTVYTTSSPVIHHHGSLCFLPSTFLPLLHTLPLWVLQFYSQLSVVSMCILTRSLGEASTQGAFCTCSPGHLVGREV